MPRLVVSLLGSFQVTLDGQAVSAFESDKVRALLAYLAAESGRPHTREKLAGLLWSDSSEAAARASLSQALTNLRQVLRDRGARPPFLLASRQSVQFNRDSDAFVDVTAFEDLLGLADPSRTGLAGLEQAVTLYRERFLEGFSLPGSSEFEEWLLLEQEHLHRLAMGALARLATACEAEGELERALAFAWRQLELDPWWESAHRQAMRLLARSGQRDAALAQYQACCRLLAEELAAKPSAETVCLYEQIRDGQLLALRPQPAPPPELQEPPLALPGFLTGQAPPAMRPVFVAREPELARLEELLQAVLEGYGQAAFVVGGPGRGKTVLLQEFARRALDAHPDLLLAMGTCNAYAGAGDPYLPFRGVLAMLTGDAEGPWASGILSTEQARRMWETLPDVAPVLARWGSGLVGTLLGGRELLGRARAAASAGMPAEADWLPPLQRLADPRTNPPGGLEQSHLCEQCANVMVHLSAQHPLLLVLDDLQWADLASIGLLFHLGRRIERGRILLAGAYRPHELAEGREGHRHPLEPALGEFRARFGDVWLDLAVADEAEGRRFIDRFVDTEPNALGEGFRERLFGQTRGHALFTIELLRAMQQRGDLVHDQVGRWTEGARLQWGAQPARVEAAIAERLARLPEELRQVLTVASVEGEEFIAQVVARAQGIDELRLLRTLRIELAGRHRLVCEHGKLRLDGRGLSLYRFAHFLFQQHLYQELGEEERHLLHRRVGEALEQVYAGRLEEAAVELARHFAGDPDRERRYARLAGERAAAQYANELAMRYLSRALELTPTSELRERYELLLDLEKVHDLAGRRDDQQEDLAELDTLAAGLGVQEQAEVARRRTGYCLFIGATQAAAAAAHAAVQQAVAAGRPGLQASCHYCLGWAEQNLERVGEAERQFGEALRLARGAGDQRIEAMALARIGQLRIWVAAYPEGEKLLRESLALAREVGDKATESLSARSLSTILLEWDRLAEAEELAEASRAVSEQMGDRQGLASALGALGWPAFARGEWKLAERYWEDAVAMLEGRGRNAALYLCGLGDLAAARGAFREAQAYGERARTVAEECGGRGFVGTAMSYLGCWAAREGRLAAAQSYLEESATVYEEVGDLPSLACTRAVLGYVLARQGQLDAGWVLVTQALRFSRSGDYPQQAGDAISRIGQECVRSGRLQLGAELIGLAFRLMPRSALWELRVEPELGMLRAALGAEGLEAALARGAALDLNQVVAEILACETPEEYWASGEGEATGASEESQ